MFCSIRFGMNAHETVSIFIHRFPFLAVCILGTVFFQAIFAGRAVSQYDLNDYRNARGGDISSAYGSALSYDSATNSSPSPGMFNPDGTFIFAGPENAPPTDSGYVTPFGASPNQAGATRVYVPDAPGDLLRDARYDTPATREISAPGGAYALPDTLSGDYPGGNQQMTPLESRPSGYGMQQVLNGRDVPASELPGSGRIEHGDMRYPDPTYSTPTRSGPGYFEAGYSDSGYSDSASLEAFLIGERDSLKKTTGKEYEGRLVTDVQIVGNARNSVERIMQFIFTRPGRPFSTEVFEDDLRRMNRSRIFVMVEPHLRNTPEGLIVIYRVSEQQIMRYLRFQGNEKMRISTLEKESGLVVGKPASAYDVEEGRKRLESYYRGKGYAKCVIQTVQGDKPADPGVIYLIHEGPKMHIVSTVFIGNKITTSARLKTVVASKPGIIPALPLSGDLEEEVVQEDVRKLADYYRRLGFFNARISRRVKQISESGWCEVTFVINEGPQYIIRDIKYLGNENMETQRLLEDMKVFKGKPFNKDRLDQSIAKIRKRYGKDGYVFADINADTRFLEEPGALDVVFQIKEGKTYRVGRVNVLIEGDFPHTQISTVLNRVSVKPGDLVSTPEIRNSERRLQSSGLFEYAPQEGNVPKIVYSPPEMDMEKQIARHIGSEVKDPNAGRAASSPGNPSGNTSSSGTSAGKASLGGAGAAAVQGGSEHRAFKLTLMEPDASIILGENEEFLDVTICATYIGGGKSAGNAGEKYLRSEYSWLPAEDEMENGEFCADGRVSVSNDDPAYSWQPGLERNGMERNDRIAVVSDVTVSHGLPKVENDSAILSGRSASLREAPVPAAMSRLKTLPENEPRMRTFAEEDTDGFTPVGTAGNARPAANSAFGRTAWPVKYQTNYGETTNYYGGPAEPVELQRIPQTGYSGGTHYSAEYTDDEISTYRDSPLTAQKVRESPALTTASAMTTQRGYPPAKTVGELLDQVESLEPFPAEMEEEDARRDTDSSYLFSSAPGLEEAPVSGRVGQVMAPPPQPGVSNTDITPFTQRPADPPLYGFTEEDWRRRSLPITIQTQETTTGRMMFSVGISSEAGLVGSVVVDEQNFDIRRWPTSFQQIKNGTAFRGAGQHFRIELAPGTQVQRYSVSFDEPYLFNSQIGLGTSAMYYDRFYRNWTETRMGGQISLSRALTYDMRAYVSFRGFNVRMSDIAAGLSPRLDEAQGNSGLYGFSFRLVQDRRDNYNLATEGYFASLELEQVIGTWNYPRVNVQFKKYWTLFERADMSGRHVLTFISTFAWSGDNTPIYESYFAGGSSTIRGFRFRDASPRDPLSGIAVGGNVMVLGSLEYLFPIMADDSIRGVVFCDTGTVERTIRRWDDKYRVSVGAGLRISVPMLGAAPVALDFAIPVCKNPGDITEIFSFTMGWQR